ncbi:MAG TPA: hypothetical protein VMM18_06565 [Gemmatimonadaceae bacterium]|nr:hypothetical protein [Gemmatimonadaceae bacterium]
MRAPIQTLRFYHQTAHLLGVQHDPAANAAEEKGAISVQDGSTQMELPLRAAAGARRRA